MGKRSVRHVLALAAFLVIGPAAGEEHPDANFKRKTAMIEVTPAGQDDGTEYGSGLLLCRKDGYTFVLTAHHVLAGEKKYVPLSRIRVEIKFQDTPAPYVYDPTDSTSERPIVSRVPKEDVLLLKFGQENLEAWMTPIASARLSDGAEGEPDPEESGENVVRVKAVGHQKGQDEWHVTDGKLEYNGRFLRHTAKTWKGFSGGPLFNETGAAIGISVGDFADDETTSHRISEAIPIERILPAIVEWVPASCLDTVGEELRRQHAFLIYRQGMQAVTALRWGDARNLMGEAIRVRSREGGIVHLEGLRYTTYLPHYHLGLALYKEAREEADDDEARELFRGALIEWDLSKTQGEIRKDRRYRTLKRLQERSRKDMYPDS